VLDLHASYTAPTVAVRAMLVLTVSTGVRDPKVSPTVIERVPIPMVAFLPVPVDEAEDLAVQHDLAVDALFPATEGATDISACDPPPIPSHKVQIVVVDQEKKRRAGYSSRPSPSLTRRAAPHGGPARLAGDALRICQTLRRLFGLHNYSSGNLTGWNGDPATARRDGL
jgi:hypothetical protein